MKHIKNILTLIAFWIIIYFLFAFLDWDIFLIERMIKSIPKEESSRFCLLVWIVINFYVYFSLFENKKPKR